MVHVRSCRASRVQRQSTLLQPTKPCITIRTDIQTCRRAFYDDALEKLQGKPPERSKKEQRAIDDFKRLVKHARGIYVDTPFRDFEAAFKGEPEFKEVRVCLWE